MSDTAMDVGRLHALILEHLHVDVPSPDVDLLESGVLDSLQLVDLLLLIEQHFGCRIPIEAIDLDHLRSLGRLAELLRGPVTAASSAAAAGDAAREPRPGSVRSLRRDGAGRRD
ncbi:MAG TPA: phosphopantetheine-binding protein [Steroidobacteraceae bacterium]